MTTTGLGALLGLFEDECRRHDCMLDRANCHNFLAKEFVLAETNPIFKGRWTDAQKEHFGDAAGSGVLPLIPLVGTDHRPDGEMPWPRGNLTARQIRNRLKGRLEMIAGMAAADALGFRFSDLPILALKGFATSELLDPIEELAKADLRDWQP